MAAVPLKSEPGDLESSSEETSDEEGSAEESSPKKQTTPATDPQDSDSSAEEDSDSDAQIPSAAESSDSDVQILPPPQDAENAQVQMSSASEDSDSDSDVQILSAPEDSDAQLPSAAGESDFKGQNIATEGPSGVNRGSAKRGLGFQRPTTRSKSKSASKPYSPKPTASTSSPARPRIVIRFRKPTAENPFWSIIKDEDTPQSSSTLQSQPPLSGQCEQDPDSPSSSSDSSSSSESE